MNTPTTAFAALYFAVQSYCCLRHTPSQRASGPLLHAATATARLGTSCEASAQYVLTKTHHRQATTMAYDSDTDAQLARLLQETEVRWKLLAYMLVHLSCI